MLYWGEELRINYYYLKVPKRIHTMLTLHTTRLLLQHTINSGQTNDWSGKVTNAPTIDRCNCNCVIGVIHKTTDEVVGGGGGDGCEGTRGTGKTTAIGT